MDTLKGKQIIGVIFLPFLNSSLGIVANSSPVSAILFTDVKNISVRKHWEQTTRQRP